MKYQQKKIIDSNNDLTKVCNNMGRDLSLILLDKFTDEIKTHIPKLKVYKGENELGKIEHIVHQLKSNCRYFGFFEYAQVCDDIERGILSNETSEIDQKIKILEIHQNHILREVDKTLLELKSSA
ncbi:MAG: Hpt domain-containing protein [Bdellovibrionales bacterium]|nr:Hpt domain-containing protein [Bdellovibrionales bacterium]NQZ17706.1 Hpt domain-containing protein [Bdellovibrionales bacterium]